MALVFFMRSAKIHYKFCGLQMRRMRRECVELCSMCRLCDGTTYAFSTHLRLAIQLAMFALIICTSIPRTPPLSPNYFL